MLAFLLSASSNLVKSAKKCFQEQFNYVRNTEEFDSINVNEVIFTSLRELLNPTLNALIKFLAMVAFALIPLFV